MTILPDRNIKYPLEKVGAQNLTPDNDGLEVIKNQIFFLSSKVSELVAAYNKILAKFESDPLITLEEAKVMSIFARTCGELTANIHGLMRLYQIVSSDGLEPEDEEMSPSTIKDIEDLYDLYEQFVLINPNEISKEEYVELLQRYGNLVTRLQLRSHTLNYKFENEYDEEKEIS